MTATALGEGMNTDKGAEGSGDSAKGLFYDPYAAKRAKLQSMAQSKIEAEDILWAVDSDCRVQVRFSNHLCGHQSTYSGS